jgi:predicted RNA-binding protein YlxR (DUF448 family)
VTAILEQQADKARTFRDSHKRDAQERTCAVTREQCDPAQLIRFVAGPDDAIVPDLKRKLPGRGVWVTASAEMVAQAVKRNAFSRSLKRPVKADARLPAQVDALLEEDARQSLAMANKASKVVSGAFQVEKLIQSGAVAVLVHASDGSSDGARKINQALFRHLEERANDVPRVEIFDSAQLGLALGQTNVIHAALRQGAASDAFLVRVSRLAEYRAGQQKQQTARARCEQDTQGAEVEDK